MAETPRDSGKIARLIHGGKDETAAKPATLEALQTDLSALRNEINRRDEILKLVLERLPAAQAASRISDADLSDLKAERDDAVGKFDHLQTLIATLTQKVSDLANPSEAVAALTELKHQIDDLRRETGSRLDRTQSELDTLKHRIKTLEGRERKDRETERTDLEKVERDIAVLNDALIHDRAMIAELRLDVASKAPFHHPSAETETLNARVDAVENEMGGLKEKVVRFLLDQMRQARR